MCGTCLDADWKNSEKKKKISETGALRKEIK